jgi:hypothetical protein
MKRFTLAGALVVLISLGSFATAAGAASGSSGRGAYSTQPLAVIVSNDSVNQAELFGAAYTGALTGAENGIGASTTSLTSGLTAFTYVGMISVHTACGVVNEPAVVTGEGTDAGGFVGGGTVTALGPEPFTTNVQVIGNNFNYSTDACS